MTITDGDQRARVDWRSILSPSAPWIYLVYLGFLFVGWLYRTPTPLELALSGLALIVFVAVYIVAMRRRDWIVIPAVLFALLLGIAVLTRNPGGAVFLVYAATMLARAEDRRIRNGGLAALFPVFIVIGLALGYSPLAIALIIGVTVMSVMGSIYGLRREQRDVELDQRRAAAVLQAAEAERQRIGRDLHDLLGQTLTMITLKAELAGRLMQRQPDRARAELAEIETVSRKALREMREAVTGLRGRTLRDGIAEAVAMLEAASLPVRTEWVEIDLPPASEAAMVMALREGTTNILRHANAESADISLGRDVSAVFLSIADDGVGGADASGGGLTGLSDRLQALGGTLTVCTGEGGQGTRLTIRLPINAGDFNA